MEAEMLDKLASVGNWILNFLPTLIACLIVIIAAYVINKFVPKLVSNIYHRATNDDAALNYFKTCAKIIVWIFAILIVLEKLGFPMASLLTVIAAVGAAFALAIKDSLANIAAGLVLLFTKPFKAGDVISVDGYIGFITDVQLIHTYINNLENSVVAIPNSKMMSASVCNFTGNSSRRQDLSIRVSYDQDVDKVISILKEVADAEPMVLKDPAPIIGVNSYGESAMTVLLRIWSPPIRYDDVRIALYKSVKEAFDANGIKVPLPQLDVHMK